MIDLKISEWDTEHFGFKVAKLPYVKDGFSCIYENTRKLESLGSKLLISRCPTNDFAWIHELERRGFHFMDVIVYYSIDLSNYYESVPLKYQSREATDDDLLAVKQIARESFQEYNISHFHADSNLDMQKCDEVYELWAINSFRDKSLSDYMMVIEIDHSVMAFLTIKLKCYGEVGETILSAVHPLARGKDVYTDIINHGIRWIQKQKCKKFETSTQLTNVSVQKAWSKLGARLDRSYCTFHLWI